jgi:glycosyltransferase involved in cell wall biosynthesis
MNICIEAQILHHHRRSGVMTYTEGLVNGLYQNDRHNQYTLTYYSLKCTVTEVPGPQGDNFKKVILPVPDRELVFRRSILDHLVIPGFLKKNKIDIFHRPSGYTMPDIKNIFKVLTVHDLRTLTIGDSSWTQNIDHYHKTLNKLDSCVVVSECTKRDMLEHFHVDEKKITVIYLGADERFKPASHEQMENIRNKYQLNEKFLFSVGSVPRKNIDKIIQGFAGSNAKEDHLLVLGSNQDIEKYKNLADSLGVGSRIRILTELTDEDIVALYSSCHCFVFPSLYEGFGLPILEAFQCGAPVITSNISSCPEVAGDAAILVNPNQSSEITEAIDQVCSNNNLRQTLIEKGFERSKLFNWNKYATEIQRVYAKA